MAGAPGPEEANWAKLQVLKENLLATGELRCGGKAVEGGGETCPDKYKNGPKKPNPRGTGKSLNNIRGGEKSNSSFQKVTVGGECAKCPLNGQPKVEGDGNGNVMIMGEALGSEEA